MMYFFWKIAHLAGVILWIGPPLGAYLMQLRMRAKTDADRSPSFEARIRAAFISVLTLEHAALLVLLTAAAGLLFETGWVFLKLFWVQAKIALFVLVILPVEILDILWGQIVPMCLLFSKTGTPPDQAELDAAFSRYDRFVLFSIPVLLPSWAAFFYLAVVKPV